MENSALVTPLEPYNPYLSDPVLQRAVEREGASETDRSSLASFGAEVGSEETFSWGADANRYSPELVTHDRFGDRIDEVRYHPAYHQMMNLSVTNGIHSAHYGGSPGDGSYVARTAQMHLVSQIEVGHACNQASRIYYGVLFSLSRFPQPAVARGR